MGVERLLALDVQVLPYIETGTDDYNDPEPEFDDPVDIKGYVEKLERGEGEENRDRETAESEWLLVLPSTSEITHRDRVIALGRTFEVNGTINKVWNPRTQVVNHIEAHLRLIEDSS